MLYARVHLFSWVTSQAHLHSSRVPLTQAPSPATSEKQEMPPRSLEAWSLWVQIRDNNPASPHILTLINEHKQEATGLSCSDCRVPKGKPCPAIRVWKDICWWSWQVPSHGFSGVAWCYFIMKKHELMSRLLLPLEARLCLFWFVAPFTWPNSFICWCLQSCFECVTTSVTSTGYCEIFVKTAFIKPLLNGETETLLVIMSCSPVRLSVPGTRLLGPPV